MLLFLARHWKLVGIGLIVLSLTASTAYFKIDRDHWKKMAAVLRIDLNKVKAEKEAEVAKHEATKRAYADAQAEAERMEAERLARITRQQEEITDGIVQTYQARVRSARAAAERLRRQAGAGVVGPASGEQVCCLPDAPGGTDGTACALSADERLTAELQTIRLESLQGWVRQQAGIPAN